jgi:hypothetical protein
MTTPACAVAGSRHLRLGVRVLAGLVLWAGLPITARGQAAPAHPTAATPARDASGLPLITDVASGSAAPGLVGDSLGDATVLEIALDGVGGKSIVAYPWRKTVLIPFGELADLVELPVAVVRPGEWTGLGETEGPVISIVLAPLRVTVNDRRVPVPDGSVRTISGVLYVSATLAGTLLDASVEPDWTEQRLRVFAAEQLPAIRRLKREATWRQFRGAPTSTDSAAAILSLERRPVGGFSADYFVSTAESPLVGALDQGSFGVTLGTGLFGGALDVILAGPLRTRPGSLQEHALWTTAFSNSFIRQFRVGDISGSGLVAPSLRGMAITNAPYVRSALVGRASYEARVTPGWRVEAYASGILAAVGIADSTGVFRADLAVGYGDNTVEFLAYGPHGERQVVHAYYALTPEFLPAGNVEYAASGGRCVSSCRTSGNVEGRLGIASWLTVRGGWSGFTSDTMPNSMLAYGALAAKPLNPLSIMLLAAPGAYSQADAQFVMGSRFRATSTYTLYAPFDSARIIPGISSFGRKSQVGGSVQMALFGPFALSGDASRTRSLFSTSDQGSGSLIIRTAVGTVEPYGRYEHLQSLDGSPNPGATVVGSRVTGSLRGPLANVLGPIFGAGSFERSTTTGESRTSLSFFRRIGAGYQAGLSYEAHTGAPARIAISLTSESGPVRLNTGAATEGGVRSYSQGAQGSVLWDVSAKRPIFSAQSRLDQATVAGIAFEDLNGNGIHDEGEPLIEGLHVRIGGQETETKDGAYRVTGLVPFMPVAMTLDSATDNPLLVPPAHALSMTLAPNATRRYDIPFVTGAVIGGYVKPAPGVESRVSGIEVLLSPHGGPGLPRATRTFSDGSFTFPAIAPGPYTISLDTTSLRRGWHGVPVQLAAASGLMVDSLTVFLLPPEGSNGHNLVHFGHVDTLPPVAPRAPSTLPPRNQPASGRGIIVGPVCVSVDSSPCLPSDQHDPHDPRDLLSSSLPPLPSPSRVRSVAPPRGAAPVSPLVVEMICVSVDGLPCRAAQSLPTDRTAERSGPPPARGASTRRPSLRRRRRAPAGSGAVQADSSVVRSAPH